MDCENIKIHYLNACINRNNSHNTKIKDITKIFNFKSSNECFELKKYYDLYCKNQITMSSPSDR